MQSHLFENVSAWALFFGRQHRWDQYSKHFRDARAKDYLCSLFISFFLTLPRSRRGEDALLMDNVSIAGQGERGCFLLSVEPRQFDLRG
jgi:hypothetical protein